MTKAKLFLFLTLAVLLTYGCIAKQNLVYEQPNEQPKILELAEIKRLDIELLQPIKNEEDFDENLRYKAYTEHTEMLILNKIKDAIESYIKQNYPDRNDENIKLIAHHLTELCDDHEVDLELIIGIIEVESQFNPKAINKRSKAMGLMQVMPFWAKDFKLPHKKLLLDIKTNIDCGIKVYKIFLVEQKGNVKRALFRYVGGCKKYSYHVLKASKEFKEHLANKL